MKILDLPLKAKWYDMIESGVKTDEYREIKPYWEKRLLNYKAIKANARGIAFKKYFLGLKFDACVEFQRGQMRKEAKNNGRNNRNDSGGCINILHNGGSFVRLELHLHGA